MNKAQNHEYHTRYLEISIKCNYFNALITYRLKFENISFLNLVLFCAFPVSGTKLLLLKVIICDQHCCCLGETMDNTSQPCKVCNVLNGTLVQNGLCPQCYEVKEQKNEQLPK
jgi:hypothetical protein